MGINNSLWSEVPWVCWLHILVSGHCSYLLHWWASITHCDLRYLGCVDYISGQWSLQLPASLMHINNSVIWGTLDNLITYLGRRPLQLPVSLMDINNLSWSRVPQGLFKYKDYISRCSVPVIKVRCWCVKHCVYYWYMPAHCWVFIMVNAFDGAEDVYGDQNLDLW